MFVYKKQLSFFHKHFLHFFFNFLHDNSRNMPYIPQLCEELYTRTPSLYNVILTHMQQEPHIPTSVLCKTPNNSRLSNRQAPPFYAVPYTGGVSLSPVAAYGLSSPRLQKQKSPTAKAVGLFWQGRKDLNPEPTVLEMMPINRHLGGLLLKC